MTPKELEAKAREIKEYQRIAEEAADAAEALRDDIKAAMMALDTDKITAGPYKITWLPIISNRLDTAAIKRDLPDLAARYTAKTTTRRFCIN